jgi:hypothetical protein
MTTALSANEFIAAVESHAKLDGGRLSTMFSDDRVFITFLRDDPKGRFQVIIDGFGQDRTTPAPGALLGNRSGPGIVQAEMSLYTFSPEYKMRKKSGQTSVIAKYVADEITKVSRSVSGETKTAAIAERVVRRFVAR